MARSYTASVEGVQGFATPAKDEPPVKGANCKYNLQISPGAGHGQLIT
jgi:hypothetical protein